MLYLRFESYHFLFAKLLLHELIFNISHGGEGEVEVLAKDRDLVKFHYHSAIKCSNFFYLPILKRH